jgi:hypothetical protein
MLPEPGAVNNSPNKKFISLLLCLKIQYMMRYLTMLFLQLTAGTPFANAQYYYKDIVSNKQARAEKALFKEQKIRNIEVHSFESDRSPSKGFFCEKKISKDYRRIETYTRSYTTSKALLTAYYNDKEQLIQSTDSSDITASVSYYQYDADGDITSIISSSHSADDDFNTGLKEEHQYIYNDKKQPVQMLRIKNNKDSVLIDFVLDEQGNVSDEIDPSPNGQHYYYYHDTKNRLTDIVKFNVVLGKLLPDFTFEYNSSNQVTQMVAVEEGVNRNYYTWKYVYNDGLRIIEKCFSKEDDLLGYFEYEYK